MTFAVGVDVGGTKIAAGVVDENGRILERRRLASPKHDAEELRDTIVEVVEELRQGYDVAAVGLGAAGSVKADRRAVYFAPHLEWGDEPVADRLMAKLDLPVVLENDANAAAWAEFRFGAGRGVDDQLMLTLGTGIGGGLVLDSELYRGGHGVAAEVGHIGLVPDGRPCPCGRRGCLEQYASGNALTHDARARAAEGSAPRLLDAAEGDLEAITGTMVTQLAKQGEPEAVELYANLAALLAKGIASLVAVLDPSLIVLGGGVSEAGDVLLHPAREALATEFTGHGKRPGPDLALAELGNDAGLIGAADLARNAEVQVGFRSGT